MTVCVASPDPVWAEPLLALLEARGMRGQWVEGVVEALAAIATGSVDALVVDVGCGSDDTALAATTLSRRRDTVALVVVGPIDRLLPDTVAHVAARYQYVTIVEHVEALLPHTAGRGGGGADAGPAPAPRIAAGAHRLLRLARSGTYFDLLGVHRAADADKVAAAADLLLTWIDTQRHGSADARHEDLVELRAAVVDARAVLRSPTARAAYTARLAPPRTS